MTSEGIQVYGEVVMFPEKGQVRRCLFSLVSIDDEKGGEWMGDES